MIDRFHEVLDSNPGHLSSLLTYEWTRLFQTFTKLAPVEAEELYSAYTKHHPDPYNKYSDYIHYRVLEMYQNNMDYVKCIDLLAQMYRSGLLKTPADAQYFLHRHSHFQNLPYLSFSLPEDILSQVQELANRDQRAKLASLSRSLSSLSLEKSSSRKWEIYIQIRQQHLADLSLDDWYNIHCSLFTSLSPENTATFTRHLLLAANSIVLPVDSVLSNILADHYKKREYSSIVRILDTEESQNTSKLTCEKFILLLRYSLLVQKMDRATKFTEKVPERFYTHIPITIFHAFIQSNTVPHVLIEYMTSPLVMPHIPEHLFSLGQAIHKEISRVNQSTSNPVTIAKNPIFLTTTQPIIFTTAAKPIFTAAAQTLKKLTSFASSPIVSLFSKLSSKTKKEMNNGTLDSYMKSNKNLDDLCSVLKSCGFTLDNNLFCKIIARSADMRMHDDKQLLEFIEKMNKENPNKELHSCVESLYRNKKYNIIKKLSEKKWKVGLDTFWIYMSSFLEMDERDVSSIITLTEQLNLSTGHQNNVRVYLKKHEELCDIFAQTNSTQKIDEIQAIYSHIKAMKMPLIKVLQKNYFHRLVNANLVKPAIAFLSDILSDKKFSVDFGELTGDYVLLLNFCLKQNQNVDEVYAFKKEMGFRLKSIISSQIMQYYYKLKEYEKAESVYEQSKNGTGEYKPNSAMYGILMKIHVAKQKHEEAWNMYTEASSLGYAIDKHMSVQMMNMYAHLGNKERYEEFLRQYINQGGVPDVTIYGMTINCYLNANEDDQAFDVLATMLKRVDIKPTTATFQNFLRKYESSKKIERVFRYMEKFGLKPDIRNLTILMQSYCKSGLMNHANQVFEKIEKEYQADEYVYAILMHGYSMTGNVVRCTELFAQVQKKGLKIGKEMWYAVVKAYCLAGSSRDAESAVTAMKEKGDQVTKEMCECFVQMYAKKGNVEKMDEWYQMYYSVAEDGGNEQRLLQSLLSGYSNVGDVRRCEDVFRIMRTKGYEPAAIDHAEMISCYFHADDEMSMNHYFANLLAQNPSQASQAANRLITHLLSRKVKLNDLLNIAEKITATLPDENLSIFIPIINKYANTGGLKVIYDILERTEKQKHNIHERRALLGILMKAYDHASKHDLAIVLSNFILGKDLTFAIGKVDIPSELSNLLSKVPKPDLDRNYMNLIYTQTLDACRFMKRFDLADIYWTQCVKKLQRQELHPNTLTSYVECLCHSNQFDKAAKLVFGNEKNIELSVNVKTLKHLLLMMRSSANMEMYERAIEALYKKYPSIANQVMTEIESSS